MKRPAFGLAAILALAAGLCVGTAHAAAGLPSYQYKRFCHDLAKGQPVMTANCETQEVLSFNEFHRIWQEPPAARIQEKCYASNMPNQKTGSGSYVKFLNCIITNTGGG